MRTVLYRIAVGRAISLPTVVLVVGHLWCEDQSVDRCVGGGDNPYATL